jgi:stage III sporulation protein AA
LLYSPPALGKTTVLKDFIRQAGSGRDALRIAVIDERCELYDNEMHSSALVDLYSVYPKDLAIENAVRTMSPQLIVCDEIGTEEEADTIISVQNCGVPIVASTHGSSFTEIKKRPGIKKLFDHNVFTSAVLLKREGNRCLFEIDEVNDV